MFVDRRQTFIGKETPLNKFIEKLGNEIEGVITGFDRLVFRGTLRQIVYPWGMGSYWWQEKVRLKDFGRHVEETSQRLKVASLAAAEKAGRPVQYLQSSRWDKE